MDVQNYNVLPFIEESKCNEEKPENLLKNNTDDSVDVFSNKSTKQNMDDKKHEEYLDDSLGQEMERHQGESIKGNNASSLIDNMTDDNDVMFNPAQRLNFDDDSEDEELSEGELVLSPKKQDSNNEEHLAHRPLTNGSDVAENDTYGIPTHSGSDQGQNIRIIEGHDSSLVDDGNLAFGFNFIQSQNVIMSSGPHHTKAGLNTSNSEDSIHNIYDSLERIDSTNLSNESHENQLENNTADLSNIAMSLYPNPQGSESDSMWAQDDNVKNYLSNLPHNQQFVHGNPCPDDPIRHQSPPRNFQTDVSSTNLNRRHGNGDDACFGGFGDCVNSIDNADDLNLELSEEGLLNNTQMYAQPIAAVSHLTMEDNFASGIGEQMHIQNQPIQEVFNSLRMGKNNAFSQPKNMASSQGFSLSELEDFHHSEGDGLDALSDERQAAAGSSLSMGNQNQSAGGTVGRQVAAVRKSSSSRVQTRRPAVQGSASSGNAKKSSSVINPRPGNGNVSAQPRRAVVSSSTGRLSGTGDSAKKVTGGVIKKKTSEGINSTAVSSGQLFVVANNQGMKPTQSMSRANSHASLVSNANSTNSRMSGVGKESQQFIFRASSQLRAGMDNDNSPEPADQFHAPVFQNSGSTTALSMNNPNKSHSQEKVWLNKSQVPYHQMSVRQSHLQPYHPKSESVGEHPQQPMMKGQPHQNALYFDGGISHRHTLNDKLVRHQDMPTVNVGNMQSQHYYNPSISPIGSDTSHHSVNQEQVLSQMEVMKKQAQQLSPNEVIKTFFVLIHSF